MRASEHLHSRSPRSTRRLQNIGRPGIPIAFPGAATLFRVRLVSPLPPATCCLHHSCRDSCTTLVPRCRIGSASPQAHRRHRLHRPPPTVRSHRIIPRMDASPEPHSHRPCSERYATLRPSVDSNRRTTLLAIIRSAVQFDPRIPRHTSMATTHHSEAATVVIPTASKG